MKNTANSGVTIMRTTPLIIAIFVLTGLSLTPAMAHEAATLPTTGLGGTSTSRHLGGHAVTSVQDFYRPLSPYGTWVHDRHHGLAWQPHAVVVDASWQPYCQGGRWGWTEWGWTWQSQYEWGWAAFHYGRWARSTHHRWVWIPDTRWGPAWVHWRWGQSTCGWAPLPPHAAHNAQLGFHYRGRNVAFNFGIELSNHDYVFVSHDRFHSRDIGTVVLTGHGCAKAYRSSTVANHTYVVQSDRLVHMGPSSTLRTGGRRSHRVHQKVTGSPAPQVYTAPSRTVYVPQTPVYHPPQVITYTRTPSRTPSRRTYVSRIQTHRSTSYTSASPSRKSVPAASHSPRTATSATYVSRPQTRAGRRASQIRASIQSRLGR